MTVPPCTNRQAKQQLRGRALYGRSAFGPCIHRQEPSGQGQRILPLEPLCLALSAGERRFLWSGAQSFMEVPGNFSSGTQRQQRMAARRSGALERSGSPSTRPRLNDEPRFAFEGRVLVDEGFACTNTGPVFRSPGIR